MMELSKHEAELVKWATEALQYLYAGEIGSGRSNAILNLKNALRPYEPKEYRFVELPPWDELHNNQKHELTKTFNMPWQLSNATWNDIRAIMARGYP
jgi:hypothetical protein